MTTGWRISWEHDSSCMLDSDEEIERWQNRLHEVTMLNCNMMIRSLCHLTTKARELPTEVGATNVEEPVEQCEKEILEQKCQDAQIWAMCATTAQGWSTHLKTSRN